MDRLTFHNPDEIPDRELAYAVICARYEGRWLFCRQKGRTTWELPGGHREPGETLGQTARRELAEETGAAIRSLTPVASYRFGDSAGMLYQAETDAPFLPDGSEMAQVILRTLPPEPMTWPELQPAMFRRIQNWLNVCVTGDELWDVYDENRRLTGRTMRRGDPIAPGDRHLGVHVWLRNADGSYLITQRSPIKGYSLLWECTGGSALAGEDSLTAAIREVGEETGLTVTAEQGERLYAFAGSDCFSDVWLFRGEFRPEEVVLQEGETCAAKVVPKHQLLQMMADREMISYAYAHELP